MGTLQTSGAISFSNMQTQLGGANPIGFNEYYRGGSYVPSTNTTPVTDGPTYIYNNTVWTVFSGGSSGHLAYWGGTLVSQGSAAVTSATNGIYTYARNTYQTSYTDPYYQEDYYSITRSYDNTININTSVPTSGTISMSNMYGARNP